MKVKQISVFLENTTGRLADVTKTIANAGINLRAISIADTADFHFFIPGVVNFTVTYGPVDKPAQIAALEFIGWALLFLFGGTVFYFPTGFVTVEVFMFAGSQKIRLPLHSRRNGPPSLLVAVNRL